MSSFSFHSCKILKIIKFHRNKCIVYFSVSKNANYVLQSLTFRGSYNWRGEGDASKKNLGRIQTFIFLLHPAQRTDDKKIDYKLADKLGWNCCKELILIFSSIRVDPVSRLPDSSILRIFSPRTRRKILNFDSLLCAFANRSPVHKVSVNPPWPSSQIYLISGSRIENFLGDRGGTIRDINLDIIFGVSFIRQASARRAGFSRSAFVGEEVIQ